ncbi:WD40 domain-containing protein [Skeletonema marinoi]|uniref:WD40 domain-containing protein n=1 Tax=Skeletonema marinoi TaxID=267567 RepID=A0AAD8Y9V3_9STRA|nr:WD40 domain-containing protein [Skeletonema marinoi]
MDFSSEPGPKMGACIRGRATSSSASYHESGSHLYVASEADSVLRIVDCLNGGGTPQMIKLQREGIRTVKATHHAQCVLFSPGLKNGPKKNNVYYLSVHDNKILREFEGHQSVVTSISMSPVDDSFLSSSADGTVRLWNAGKSGNSLCELKLPQNVEGPPLAAFDSTGLVFGITAKMAGDEGNHINLFDARNYSAGPFSEMQVKRQDIEAKLRASGSTPERAYALSRSEWTSIDFNKSGKQILIGTNGGVAHTVDGYEGSVMHSFQMEGGAGSTPLPMATCFSSDDQAVICGNNDGTVSCYQADSGLLARKLRGHVDRVNCLAANPKYAQIASSCTNTIVWVW